jgi:hypothetical protein
MKWLVFFFVLFIAAHTYGADLDAASSEALGNTEDLLKDRKAREKAASENSDTKKAHDLVKQTAGDEKNVDEVYGLSSDIFGYLAAKYKGDPAQLQKALFEAQANPEGFYKSLPAEMRDKIRGIASKVPQPTQPKH